MLDQTGSSIIRVLPLHIAILTTKLLLDNLRRPVTHRIPIGILLSQPPCVPVNRLLSTLARHFAREATSEIKIFLSNALVSHCWATLTSWINITIQEIHGTLLVYLIWILYFLCIGLFSPIITIYNQEGYNLKNNYCSRQNPPKKASWPGFLASSKDSRTKVVLARKL